MKGASHMVWFGISILLMFVALVILLPMVSGQENIDWMERFGFSEEDYATEYEGEEEMIALERTYTDMLPEASKIMRSSDFYVSEIACDIANNINYDFSQYGEEGRHLDYVDIDNAYIDLLGGGCEYSPDNQDYICIVGYGSFLFDGTDEILNTLDRADLQDAGCCDLALLPFEYYCGCTHTVGPSSYVEYKLDEVCINEMLNGVKFKGSDPFCTLTKSDRLFLDNLEVVYFGNRDCYANSQNTDASTEGWDWDSPATCSNLCDAQETGLEKWEYDRIVGFWADESNQADSNYFVNDDFIDSANLFNSDQHEILQDKMYFYNVLWYNKDKEKRYATVFYRVPHMHTRSFKDEAEFNKFVVDTMRDNVRNNTGGRYWPELATVYNGTITLNAPVDIADLKLALESEFNVYADEVGCCVPEDEDCFGASCLDYGLRATVWGEYVEKGIWPTDLKTTEEAPIDIRINPDLARLPSGEYRLVIRNWYGGLFYDDQYEPEACEKPDKCGPLRATHHWCLNENEKAQGKRIFEVEKDFDCTTSTPVECCIGPPLSRRKRLHYKIRRYVDRAVILIQV